MNLRRFKGWISKDSNQLSLWVVCSALAAYGLLINFGWPSNELALWKNIGMFTLSFVFTFLISVLILAGVDLDFPDQDNWNKEHE